MNDLLFLDIETAGPGFEGLDNLLLIGWALNDGPIFVYDKIDGPANPLLDLLRSPQIAIVSQSTYDPAWLMEAGVEVNGPFIDTKVMAWVLNENTPLDLDWLAFRYANIDMDKRLKRHSGEVYFRTDGDQEINLKDMYLHNIPGSQVWKQFVDYNRRDVEALRKLYYNLEELLQESGWEEYWLREEVPYTRPLVEMQLRGIPVDLEATAQLEERVRRDVEQYGQELIEEANLPPSFNLNSPDQLAAYLFGRVVHFNDRIWYDKETIEAIKSCQKGEHEDCPVWDEDYECWGDTPVCYTESFTESNKCLCADDRPGGHIIDFLPEGFTIEKVGHNYVSGYWTSRGRGLAPTPPPTDPLTGKVGKHPSTSSPDLLYLHPQDPWVAKLCGKYRKGKKLLTTYLTKFPKIARVAEGVVSGSDTLKSRGNDRSLGSASTTRLYGRFNQTGTVTGRLSSSEPNLQNMPVRPPWGPYVRDLFRGDLVVADYDQLEMRLMAHLSGDPRLVKVFADGEDPHYLTAQAIFGGQPSDEQRDIGKTMNYAMGYGARGRRIAQTLSLVGFPTSVEEAKGYLDELIAFYRVLFRWMEGVKRAARQTGNVSTLGGRRRRLSGAFKDTANWKLVGYGERQAVNSIIQGTAADVVRRAMIGLDAEQPFVPPMIAQVHDEVIFDISLWVPESYDLISGEQDMLDTIQAIGETGHGFDLRVPLKFEPHVVGSWAEKKGAVDFDALFAEDYDEEE